MMARFNFHLRPGSGRDATVPRGALPAAQAAEPGDPDAHSSAGWFESSWELEQGLEVREGLPADARPHERLGAWLHGEPALPADAARLPA